MKLKVAVVGATGIAGQQFLTALEDHPWFDLTCVAGSERSAGKRYIDAIKTPNGQVNWFAPTPIPTQYANMTIQHAEKIDLDSIDIVFVAVESAAALELEKIYAQKKPTISTASAHRMDDDVPLYIPGINDDHREIILKQQKNRNWQGFVVPIPNCTTFGLASSLYPIHKAVGIKFVVMTSLQATSGAGRNGGVLSLDMIDNLVPYIPGEEEKVEREVQKILGTFDGNQITDSQFSITCTCTRVPVTDGHTEAVFVATEKPLTPEAASNLFANFEAEIKLPSSPENFFHLHQDPFHPQPRLDRELDGGMTTHIGRIRPDTALNGIKYVLLSHNTKAGAAKGALLVAESLIHHGLITSP